MRPALRRLFLLALATDSEAEWLEGLWSTRCLHCRARLYVSSDGTPRDKATLEHVVPRAWFGKRAAARLCERAGANPDDARNLALACTRCNQGKGKSHDARGPTDARAYEVVERLLTARFSRWRDAAPNDEGG